MLTQSLFVISLVGLSVGAHLTPKVYKHNQPAETLILTPYISPEPSLMVSPTHTKLPEPTPTIKVLTKTRFEGKVSHYSEAGCLGCSSDLRMSNGEKLDDTKATIAMNGIPMNTMVKITNTDNGKSMLAKVTDTGGFEKYGRIADLTPVVYQYLETKTDKSLVIIELVEN